MDFYCGAFGDFVVPKDQDLLDRIPSPDTWSKWGMSAPDSFSSLDKVLTSEAKTTKADFNFDHRRFGHDTGLEKSFHDKIQSSCSGTTRGSSEPSFNPRVASYDQTNYQLQDLGAFEATDDYFLNSILEYPQSAAVNQNKYLCTPSGSRLGKSQCDNPLADVTLESSSVVDDVYDMEVSDYAEPLPFSSPEDCSTRMSSKERRFPSKEGEKGGILAPHGQESRNHYLPGHYSLEEFILRELEMVISQFTEKTRMCFRDALYRLAINSNRQQTDEHYLDGCTPMKGEKSWLDPTNSIRHGEGEEPEPMELETNTIDRAIANLMFEKMDFNLQKISVATSANAGQQMMGTVGVTGSPFCSTQIQNLQYLPNAQGDAEVPRFSDMEQNRGRVLNETASGSPFMLDFGSVT